MRTGHQISFRPIVYPDRQQRLSSLHCQWILVILATLLQNSNSSHATQISPCLPIVCTHPWKAPLSHRLEPEGIGTNLFLLRSRHQQQLPLCWMQFEKDDDLYNCCVNSSVNSSRVVLREVYHHKEANTICMVIAINKSRRETVYRPDRFIPIVSKGIRLPHHSKRPFCCVLVSNGTKAIHSKPFEPLPSMELCNATKIANMLEGRRPLQLDLVLLCRRKFQISSLRRRSLNIDTKRQELKNIQAPPPTESQMDSKMTILDIEDSPSNVSKRSRNAAQSKKNTMYAAPTPQNIFTKPSSNSLASELFHSSPGPQNMNKSMKVPRVPNKRSSSYRQKIPEFRIQPASVLQNRTLAFIKALNATQSYDSFLEVDLLYLETLGCDHNGKLLKTTVSGLIFVFVNVFISCHIRMIYRRRATIRTIIECRRRIIMGLTEDRRKPTLKGDMYVVQELGMIRENQF